MNEGISGGGVQAHQVLPFQEWLPNVEWNARACKTLKNRLASVSNLSRNLVEFFDFQILLFKCGTPQFTVIYTFILQAFCRCLWARLEMINKT